MNINIPGLNHYFPKPLHGYFLLVIQVSAQMSPTGKVARFSKKNTGCLVKFEFQTHNAIIHFSINLSHVIFGTYLY